MVRGLDRKQIYRDDKDREEFLIRLERVLEKTGCTCYAWSLMPNHYHLLMRSGRESISTLMRRLQTGYALYYNRRHKKAGYLFQNRFKSILCDEETYFLELVRYIHLNPLRAKIVNDLRGLDEYRWSGHQEIVKGGKRKWQGVEEVLSRFGSHRRKAQEKYRAFVQDGLKNVDPKRWLGGGLVRSLGGWKGVVDARKAGERWRSDERILGDGEFVEKVLREAGEKLGKIEERKRKGWNMDRLMKEVAKLFGIHESVMTSRSRGRSVAIAKGVWAYYAYEELGEKGASIARVLGITRPAVTKAVLRGRKFVEENHIKLIS